MYEENKAYYQALARFMKFVGSPKLGSAIDRWTDPVTRVTITCGTIVEELRKLNSDELLKLWFDTTAPVPSDLTRVLRGTEKLGLRDERAIRPKRRVFADEAKRVP